MLFNLLSFSLSPDGNDSKQFPPTDAQPREEGEEKSGKEDEIRHDARRGNIDGDDDG